MLSTRQITRTRAVALQRWPWSGPVGLHSLTGVQEADVDREEYHARLGVVLQMARKAAKVKQADAATHLGMNPVSFTRWEAGTTGIGAYELARLVKLYGLEIDAELVLNPPTSKVEIRRRLEPIAAAAQRALRRGLLRPLEDLGDDGEPE